MRSSSSYISLKKQLIEKGQGEEIQPLLTALSDANGETALDIFEDKQEVEEKNASAEIQSIPEEKQEKDIFSHSFSKPDLLIEINACIAILEKSKMNNVIHKNDQRKKYNTILLLGFLGMAFSFGEIGLSLALMLVVMNIMHARLVPSLKKQLNEKNTEASNISNQLSALDNIRNGLVQQHFEEDRLWPSYYAEGPYVMDNCVRWRGEDGKFVSIWDYYPELKPEPDAIAGLDACSFKDGLIHPRPECQISAEKLCALDHNITTINNQMDDLDNQLSNLNLQIDDVNNAIAHPKPETITTIIFVITTVAFLTLTGVIGYKLYQKRKQHIENTNRTPEIDEGVNQYADGVRLVNLLTRLKINPKTFKAMTTDQLIARLTTEKEKIKKKFAFFGGMLDPKANNNNLLTRDAGADVSRRIMDYAFPSQKPR